MSRCEDCTYFTQPQSKYSKGECTWYNTEYYPEDKTCSHFNPGNSSTCGNCEHFTAPDSRYSKGLCTWYDREYYADESACSKFSSSSSGGGCYLTTACCEFKGLADDCYELTVLRRFRDTYLKEQPFGETLIATYYEDAPSIVKKIDNHSDRAGIYEDIYVKLCEIVKIIESGKNDYAIISYMSMVYGLHRKLFPVKN